jgi:hypothetical protein
MLNEYMPIESMFNLLKLFRKFNIFLKLLGILSFKIKLNFLLSQFVKQ